MSTHYIPFLHMKTLVSKVVIWVLRHISTKRLYRAEYAIKYTSNMQKVLNGCTAIKMRKVGYVVKYADQRLS